MEQQPYTDEQNEISLKDILRIVRSRKLLLAVTFLLSITVVMVYLYLASPVYSSSATLWIEPSQSGSSFEDLFTVRGSSGSASISTEVEIIKSRRNLEKLIEELNLVERYSSMSGSDNRVTTDSLVRHLSGAITVNTVKDTNIVRISVEHTDYLLARDIANTLAVVYNNLLRELAQNEFSVRREFIESQIGPALEQVEQAENRLREFKEEEGVFALEEEAGLLLEYITKYEQQIEPYRLQRQEALNKQQVYADDIRQEGGTVYSYEEVVADSELREKISEMKNTKLEYVGYTDQRDGEASASTSRTQDLRSRLVRLENEIRARVNELVFSQVESTSPYVRNNHAQMARAYTQQIIAEANISYLTELKTSYEEKMVNLPRLEQRLLELKRDVKVKENLYLLLLENFEEAKIAEAAVSGTSTIIDEAVANNSPIKPNKKMLLAVGALLGLFLGALLVFLMETFDDSVKDEETIRRIFGQEIPIVGRIPHLQFDYKEEFPELIVYNNSTSPAAESFKLISTNVLYSKVSRPQIVCFGSSEMAAGKTTVCANTAIAMAQNGMRTLLIDADMRKPRLEQAFGLERAVDGLVNHLLLDKELKELILQPLDELPNLHLLPVGPIPPNPTALITSEKFKQAFTKLKGHYDHIIVDLPPLLAASDGLIVVRETDGLVMVVRMGNTSKSSLQLIGENIGSASVPFIGIVTNDQSKLNSYDYYHYYYYYSGDEGRKQRRKSGGSTFRKRTANGKGRQAKQAFSQEEDPQSFQHEEESPGTSTEPKRQMKQSSGAVLKKSSIEFLSEIESEEYERNDESEGPDDDNSLS
ncbi:MAG: GumC family protein [Spirochaetota bacterium]